MLLFFMFNELCDDGGRGGNDDKFVVDEDIVGTRGLILTMSESKPVYSVESAN